MFYRVMFLLLFTGIFLGITPAQAQEPATCVIAGQATINSAPSGGYVLTMQVSAGQKLIVNAGYSGNTSAYRVRLIVADSSGSTTIEEFNTVAFSRIYSVADSVTVTIIPKKTNFTGTSFGYTLALGCPEIGLEP